MKGIILASGSGTRLYPLTIAFSKQLMPIYDKPMIYYPLATLLEVGIREILIITTSLDLPRYKRLLGDGSQLGCEFKYITVDTPVGLPIAFIVGEKFIGRDKVALILGDNFFYGTRLDQQFRKYLNVDGAIGFAAYVNNPQDFGVYEFDQDMNVISIKEKPRRPKSNYANTGLYFFDNEVVRIAKKIRPSARGELEITSVLNKYLGKGKLKVCLLKKDTVWIDTGTIASLAKAAQFVQTIETKRELKIGCPEETAYHQGFIGKKQLHRLARKLTKSGYGEYLLGIS